MNIDDFGVKNSSKLFYYAGHGIQSKGYNYLIPVDARLNTEKPWNMIAFRLTGCALMEGSKVKVYNSILDACRNNPFERVGPVPKLG